MSWKTLAASVERDTVLALTGGAFLLPFSLNHLMEGRFPLGAATTALSLWFLGHGLAVHLGRRLVPAWVIFMPALGVLAVAMRLQGELGIFWCYPAILLFHFVLERRAANFFNVTVLAMAVPFAYAELGAPVALRVAATLALTIAFANVFSFLTERQQRLSAEQERELALERDRLGLLVHATQAGFTDWDAEAGVILYSERFKEMLGYPRDADTSGWPPFFERMHPEDRAHVQGVFRAMLRQDRRPGLQQPGQALDYRLRKADGSYLWVHAEGLAQVNDSLRISRFITSYQDITKFRDQEQALASERRRLELVVRAGNIGFLDWDGVARAAYYSPRFKEILGYPVDADTSGWPDYFDMVHPEDKPRVHGRFKEHIVQERSEEHEPTQYRLRRADGGYVWVEAVGLSVRNEAGFATRFIASIRDISAQRAEEQARLTEQRRLDLVVSAARVGIVDWDGRTHETFYSPRFREMLGYAPDADTSEWPAYFEALIHPEDRRRVTKRWQAFILGQGPEGPHGTFYSPEQYRLLRADGSHVWVQASGVAVRDEKGLVLRWIAAVADITEQRRQEETLRESVRLREEVERMSRHDLKTPLNSIIAVPKLLREARDLSADELQLLGIVERAGYRILNLVNLSLDLFRMEQGRYTFRAQAVEMGDLVAKVIDDLEGHAATKGVRIVVDRAPEALYARAEELLCYSMLANLLKNAIEASPEGGEVTITLQSGPGVLVHVHNAGAVPESVRERFFDKYSTAGKPEGLGLGTYSALLMARVQEGNITMRTSEEEGTTLTVQLAEAPPESVPAPEEAASPERGPARMPALAPLDVLVVDDDEFNRLVMGRYLPSPPLGRVAMAVNGHAALEAMRAHRYDYVFLDLEMPLMSGYEAAERIRALEKDERRKPSVLVAFSSNDDDRSIRRALAAGCDHYLTKPAPRETLWRILSGAPVVQKKAEAKAGPSDAIEVDVALRPTLPAFFLSRRETLGAIEGLLAAHDRAGLRRLAHKLAGSFSLYGFKWAAAQCRLIERASPDADPADLAARIEAVRAHLDSAQLKFVEAAQA